MNYPESIPAAYQSDDLERAYRIGWRAGHGIACYNVPSIGDRIASWGDIAESKGSL